MAGIEFAFIFILLYRTQAVLFTHFRKAFAIITFRAQWFLWGYVRLIHVFFL